MFQFVKQVAEQMHLVFMPVAGIISLYDKC